MRVVNINVPYGATDAVVLDLNGDDRVARRGYRLTLIVVERRGDLRLVTLDTGVMEDRVLSRVAAILSPAVTGTAELRDNGASGVECHVLPRGVRFTVAQCYLDHVLFELNRVFADRDEQPTVAAVPASSADNDSFMRLARAF